MSKLKSCKKIKEETKTFQKAIDVYIKSLKQEYKKNIFNCKNELLEAIAENEGLELDYLKKKYLKKIVKDKQPKKEESISNNDELLEVLVYEGLEYFYENKELGAVYDDTSNIVGRFINGKVVFDS
jgi:hypothetical protein